MKKLLFALFAMVFTFNIALAQEVYVKTEITEASSDKEELQQQFQMLLGSQSDSYFKGDKSLVTMDMMGGMIKMVKVYDAKSDQLDILMDAMGQKLWMSDKKSEMTKVTAKEFSTDDVIIKYDKKDTKEILGKKCYKFSIELKDVKLKEEMSIVGYLTDSIQIPDGYIQGFEKIKLEGLPLEVSIKNPMVTLTTQAVKVENKVDDKVFELDTEGYQKITAEEFRNMSGGMGM